MPYEWSSPPPQTQPEWSLSLWPYRSLLRRDFVLFMGGTAAIIALPLLVVIGSAVLWGLLPFFVIAFTGLWYAFSVTYRRGEVLEELTVDTTSAHLTRHDPRAPRRDWHANRHWVSVHLHPKGGPVENYITLRGGDREVEIGAFLDAAERLALYDELKRAMRG
ncbi:DUF2244 domain-containing protein [Loktanella sp. SALINAS62]|uniref:DUF2244 domain-containing protein n=1 Tax=Loktanella sp. SALINAS62 TaxID=2706124 RepID=UPI001B8C413B|nr:DUF2244 domain-containing protein [Loktanella sp. SALINAS62]MBS1302979.1 DUF2244 domain-containing protein [Loktanella sp. SALINAS62]